MDKIKNLEQQILKHKHLYYQGKPEISDFEYDALEEELRRLKPTSEVLELVGTLFTGEQKVEHSKKMLSLNKTYKLDELIKWADNKSVLSTFKIDGSSCSIIYEGGSLVIAKTRGDGKVGENITQKILHLASVPRKISYQGKFEIRGEVYCDEKNFIHLSEVMTERGLEKPTSQRNIVAGLLGRKENIDLASYLNFQAFELFQDEVVLKTEEEKFHLLQKLKFETPEFFINKTKEDFEQRLNESREFMTNGDYLIDGLVFSYNELSLHESLGETAHHPRYKMAFKFQGETKTTLLKEIVWQVSRNGILTPVAQVVPVELSGAKVSRVTLHNYGMVNQYQLKSGDEIEIVRSGEVIPKFLSVVQSSENPFIIPETCPSCEKPTSIEDIRLICKNDNCPDKVKDEILNFIQKIGIEDLSSKRLEEMIKMGIVSDIPSLYQIDREKLLTMDKVKDKLADKILESIEGSKKADLITFLASLGINGGAYNKCEKIVINGYDTIEKVMNLNISQLELIESFAEKSATEFVNSLKSKSVIVEKLISYGFELKVKLAPQGDSSVSGMKFCITGTLTMKRSELQKIVKANGGIVQSGVSKETNYLITNDETSTSSKFKKALELKIPIIKEAEFFKLIEK